MAVGIRYTNSFMNFLDGGTSELLLVQLDSETIDPGIQNMQNHQTGIPDRGFIAAGPTRPMISADTYEIARFLGKVNPRTGLAIETGGDDIETLNIYFAQKRNLGDRAGAGDHYFVTVQYGLVVPQRLSVRTGEEAKLTFAVYPIVTSDSAAPYYPISDDENLLTTSLPPFEKFTLGPISIAGTLIEDARSFDLDFGLEIEVEHEGGSIYPKFVGIKRRLPVATIGSRDLRRYFSAQAGELQGGTATVVYLRKKAEGGNVIANATAEHISFTFPASKSKIDAGQISISSTNETAETSIQMYPQKPSASDIFSVNTATAIT